MKKRALSIFLTSILVISCFLYVFPLNSFALVYLDSEGAWTIPTGEVGDNFIYSTSNNARVDSYTYSSSTGWTPFTVGTIDTKYTQVPSPFASSKRLRLTFSNFGSLRTQDSDDWSILSFDFVGGLKNYIQSLNLKSGDYLCFAQRFQLRVELSSINYSFAHIVTGNSFEPVCNIDDRFLVFNPSNVLNMPQSLGLDNNLWSLPSTGSYILLAYFNIAYDDLIAYEDYDQISAIVVSLNGTSISSTNSNVSAPLIYKCSLNGDVQTINYLNSIDSNVQVISDVVQQGSYVAPPSTTPDYSTVNNLEDDIQNFYTEDNIAWQTINTGFASLEIVQGLAWVGSFVSTYYTAIPFLKGVFALILCFQIHNLLMNGWFSRDRNDEDYVYHKISRFTDSNGRTVNTESWSRREKK